MKTTSQQGKKMIGVPMDGFEPTPSCLWINCAKPCATGYMLIGGNRVSQFNFAHLSHFPTKKENDFLMNGGQMFEYKLNKQVYWITIGRK